MDFSVDKFMKAVVNSLKTAKLCLNLFCNRI